jgi:hypothetical protein
MSWSEKSEIFKQFVYGVECMYIVRKVNKPIVDLSEAMSE